MDKVRNKSLLCIWISALTGLILVLSSFFTACKVSADDDVKIKHVKITYKTEFGEKPEAKEVDENTKISPDLIKELLPELTAEGYTFMGWFLEDSDTQITGNESEPFVIKADIVLVAKWSPSEYKITYETEYGTAPAAKNVTYGTAITETMLPSLSAEGLEFLGWFLGETQVTGKEEEPVLIKADITLTAKWNVIKHKVTYKTEKDTAPEAFEIEYGKKLTAEQLPELTAEGFTFEGWYAGETKLEADSFEVTEDVELTAKWSTVKCKVSYSSSQGTAPKAFTVDYGTYLTAENLEAIKAEGCEFLGWYIGETKIEAGYAVKEDVILTAKWQPLKGTIIYETEHGTKPASVTLDFGTVISANELPELKEEGYTFLGWYNGKNKVEAGTVTVGEEGLTLTAKWETIKCKVSYSSSLGTAPKSFTADYGTKLSAEQLPSLTSEGYTFSGWYAGETKAVAGTYTVKSDVELTAKWEEITLTVSYKSDYGTAPASFKVKYGTALTAENIAALSADGCNFLGWYINSTETKASAGYAVKDNVQLTAKWEVISCKVTYSTAQAKASVPKDFSVNWGTILKAENLPELTQEGYTFLGWYIGTTKVTAAASYAVKSDVTLTAKWQIQTFKITYKTDKGTAPEAITVDYGTKLSAAQLPSLTGEGLSFLGWYAGETKAEAGSYTVKADVELTAKWEVSSYTVTYKTDLGTAPAAITVEHGTKLSASQLPSLTITGTGAKFIGWCVENTDKVLTAGSYEVKTAVTLVAKWNKNTYKVTYQTAYGTAPDAITVEYGTKLSTAQLKVLTDAEYDFVGWYVGETKVEAGVYVVEDAVTLVAQWKEKQVVGKISLKVSTTETLELTYVKTTNSYIFTAPDGNYTYKWSIDGVEAGTGNTFVLDDSNAPLAGEYTVHVTVFANGKAVNDAFTTVKIER